MFRVRPVIFLAIILFLSSLLFACTDQEYNEIQFQEFPPSYQQYDRMPWEMLELDTFSDAYTKILEDFPGDQYLDDYISEIFVVSTGNRFVSTHQGSFIYMVGCKPHFCDVARVFILFDPEDKSAWAFAYDLGITGNFEVWLGQPDDKIKKLMRELESMIHWI